MLKKFLLVVLSIVAVSAFVIVKYGSKILLKVADDYPTVAGSLLRQSPKIVNHNKTSEKITATKPEYPKITLPSKLSSAEIEKNTQSVMAQITDKLYKVVYFSKIEQENGERSLVANKSESEYYRIIHGTTSNGNCIIQDFYSENDKPQSNHTIVSKNSCINFVSAPLNGMLVEYNKNGLINSVSYVNKNNSDMYQLTIASEEKIEEIDNVNPMVIEIECNKKNKQHKVTMFIDDNIMQLVFLDNNRHTLSMWDKKNENMTMFNTNNDSLDDEDLKKLIKMTRDACNQTQ